MRCCLLLAVLCVGLASCTQPSPSSEIFQDGLVRNRQRNVIRVSRSTPGQPDGDSVLSDKAGKKYTLLAGDEEKTGRQRRQASLPDAPVTTHPAPSGLFTTITLPDDGHPDAIVDWATPSIIYVQTLLRIGRTVADSTFYRSVDSGKTFQEINFRHSSVIQTFVRSETDPQKVIFTDPHFNEIWITRDAGATVHSVTTPFRPEVLSMSPFHHVAGSDNHVLALDSTNDRLYLSTDFCQTWTHVSDDIKGGVWAFDDHEVLDEHPNGLLFFEKHVNGEAQNSVHLMIFTFTLNAGGSPRIHFEEFDRDLGAFRERTLKVEGHYMFIQKNEEVDSLHVSYQMSPFHKCLFPGAVHQTSYVVADVAEGKVFLAVYVNKNATALYSSDETGRVYNLLIPKLVTSGRDPVSAIDLDFHRVQGVEGVYIVNELFQDPPGKGHEYLRTLITFDKGGQWQTLAPTAGSCAKCSLHLHMHYTRRLLRKAPIKSFPSAPGLIIAQGNIGDSLTQSSRVYISEDAGLTWRPMLSGSHTFLSGDHGAFLLSTYMYSTAHTPTSHLLYSCDGGRTMQQYQFSSTDLAVAELVNEPDAIGRNAMVFASSVPRLFSFVPLSWHMIMVNVSVLLDAPCSHSNYQNWTLVSSDSVKSKLNRNCVNGEVVTYERRNPSTCCYNGLDYLHAIRHKPCACAREDYECDYGYVRSSLSAPCTKQAGVNAPLVPENCTSTYNRSQGYRKVAASGCVGASPPGLEPVVSSCSSASNQGNTSNHHGGSGNSSKSTSKKGKVVVPVVLSLVVITAICVAVALYLRRRRIQQQMNYGQFENDTPANGTATAAASTSEVAQAAQPTSNVYSGSPRASPRASPRGSMVDVRYSPVPSRSAVGQASEDDLKAGVIFNNPPADNLEV